MTNRTNALQAKNALREVSSPAASGHVAEGQEKSFAEKSHDLRTPLNAIIGITNLLRSGKLPPERQDECLSTLLSSAQQLLAMVDGLSGRDTATENTTASSPLAAMDRTVQKASGGYKVLLVEDYKANVLVASALLESMGFSYDLAETGKEALDKLSSQPYDLVLMDVRMPDMDGYQATQMLREREKSTGGHVPVIGMTAHALLGDRQKCLDVGMDNYISKPFHPQELQKLIETYTVKRRSA